MKIYVAGPMRGYPKYNFPAFKRVAEELIGRGWDVTNPAEIENDLGWDEDTPESEITRHHLVDVMLRGIKVLSGMDAICMLLGYEESSGAMVELSMAEYIGIPVYFEGSDYET